MAEKRRISFEVDEEDYTEIMQFAKIRWFKKPAILARFALKQYMSRYPLKVSEIARTVQPQENKNESIKGGDVTVEINRANRP